ncbi:hypothetical protein FMM82_35075 [[Clostridium] clostridioforme]|nr:hypothetical protein [Enterocloster clostridioformis]
MLNISFALSLDSIDCSTFPVHTYILTPYRYNIRFALPVYDDKTGKIARHNIYSASMLVRHANDGRKYLYDILAIKKETSSPLE